jgi:hypothetical protein
MALDFGLLKSLGFAKLGIPAMPNVFHKCDPKPQSYNFSMLLFAPLMIALRASALPPSRTRRTPALCRRPIS